MISSVLVVAMQVLSHIAVARAECVRYSLTTVVECGPATALPPPPNPAITTSVVTVTLPECSCGCKSADNRACVYTKTYTTEYEALCPTGVAIQTWTVEEVYPGATAEPTISGGHPNGVPPGFTASVVTCETCGPAAVTKTVTYPIGGNPIILAPTSGLNSGNNDNTKPGDNQRPGAGGMAPNGQNSETAVVVGAAGRSNVERWWTAVVAVLALALPM